MTEGPKGREYVLMVVASAPDTEFAVEEGRTKGEKERRKREWAFIGHFLGSISHFSGLPVSKSPFLCSVLVGGYD